MGLVAGCVLWEWEQVADLPEVAGSEALFMQQEDVIGALSIMAGPTEFHAIGQIVEEVCKGLWIQPVVVWWDGSQLAQGVEILQRCLLLKPALEQASLPEAGIGHMGQTQPARVLPLHILSEPGEREGLLAPLHPGDWLC